MYDLIRHTMLDLQAQWNTRPVLVLACGGYADEHWQFWHPTDYTDGGMPHLVLAPDGTVERHPDSTR